jgi:hypothetical protein
MGQNKTYDSGAIRSDDGDKIDPEASLSPLAVLMYCEYMKKHTLLPDGSKRLFDNWQQGFPKDRLIKSLLRHSLDLWLYQRDFAGAAVESEDDALSAIFFNVQTLMHQRMKEKLSKADTRTYRTMWRLYCYHCLMPMLSETPTSACPKCEREITH